MRTYIIETKAENIGKLEEIPEEDPFVFPKSCEARVISEIAI